MTPYMQPYIDAGMVFVAAKLVAGAGLDSIKPLAMTYQGTTPMIPLQLTAVATEPHLTVTALIYANGDVYQPIGHPITTIDETRLSQDSQGRLNYPMLLARTIDEAGGNVSFFRLGAGYDQVGGGNTFNAAYATPSASAAAI